MNEAIHLRPEKSSDETFLRSLFATTRVDVTFSGLPPDQKQLFLKMQFDAQRLHYRTKYKDTEFLIIEQYGRRIGRLYLCRMPDQIRVMDITLIPEHRNQGIGSGLIRSVQDEARTKGLPVTLHAEKVDQTADYYRHLGFEVAAELEMHYFMKWVAGSSVILT